MNDSIATQLSRIYYAVEHMAGIEGQDPVLVLEMSQQMLADVINGYGLKPMAEYVKRYCDVIDGPEDAERIAADL